MAWNGREGKGREGISRPLGQKDLPWAAPGLAPSICEARSLLERRRREQASCDLPVKLHHSVRARLGRGSEHPRDHHGGRKLSARSISSMTTGGLEDNPPSVLQTRGRLSF